MRLRSPCLWLLAFTVAACGDDDPKPSDADATSTETTTSVETDAEDDTVVPPGDPFAFGIAGPNQPISDAPFPNDLVRADDSGMVAIAPLKDDARFATLANANIIDRLSAQVNSRAGFSFSSAVYFPMGVEPDLTTFEGAVHYVALSGPEEGKVFAGQAFWFSHASYLGVVPAWGDYLVPGGQYAVFIDVGVKDTGGNVIETPQAFADLVAAEAPSGATAELTRARNIYAGLRAHLATRDTAAVVGTVFSTEDAMGYLAELLAVARAQPLVTPTRNVRSTSETELVWEEAIDVHGADLEDYFGVRDLESELRFTPGGWDDGNRDDAKALTADGEPYLGGTFAKEIGWVVNGSIVVPSFNLAHGSDTTVTSSKIALDGGGAPTVRSRAAVPFTVFFCTSHVVADALTADPIPVAIFTHGGTALRSDALAFANVNCLAGRATVVLDLPFHGGRQKAAYFASADLVVPTQADAQTTYKASGAAGRTSDYIGDNAGATTTVGGMFALPQQLDPEVIEANLLAIAVEHDTLVRYLKDTSATGLGAALGVTFDTTHLVHESLSFGTSFGTAFLAGTDHIDAAVISVGSGMMLSVNLPMAPNNANLASTVMTQLLGLKSTLNDLVTGAYKDPIIAFAQWLAQRGDPIAYAPFALRHRQDGHTMDVLGFGDSWDETLFSPAQLSFGNAWGVPVFTSEGWAIDPTIPGSDTLGATPFPAQAPSDNLTYGGRTQSAAYFYLKDACHAQVVTPVCVSSYLPPYPPPTFRPQRLIFQSPICAIQRSVLPFLGDPAVIAAPPEPSADDHCGELYD